MVYRKLLKYEIDHPSYSDGNSPEYLIKKAVLKS